MKRLALPLTVGLVALVGLACSKPVAQPVVPRVEVPTPIPCPQPRDTPRPIPRLGSLPEGATRKQRAQALLDDFAAWIAYALELEKVIDGYRAPNPTTAPKETR